MKTKARIPKKRAGGSMPTETAVAEWAPQPRGKSAKPLDPDRCATPRCRGKAVMTHLGRPLCQECWDMVAAEEKADEPDITPAVEIVTGQPLPEKAKTAAKPAKAKTPKTAKSAEAKTPKTTKSKADAEPKRLSALDAAAQVLAKAGKPMRAQELIAAMAEQGLWTSPAGKTPHATLYAAMMREVNAMVNDINGRKVTRFRKVDRGLFTFNEHSKR